MGPFVDYFKPINTSISFCDMLVSSQLHMWNPNADSGSTWIAPPRLSTPDGHFGGSAAGFPFGIYRDDAHDRYFKKPGVGSWGGVCTCPSGIAFKVGDNSDSCKSLACFGGTPGT